MADHVKGFSCLEEDFVHHGQPRMDIPPALPPVIGKKDADLVAGGIVAEIRPGSVQPEGVRSAKVHGGHKTAAKAFRQRGRIKVNA